MTKMASQITSLTVVYSTVYSDADQIKHQSSASLAFVWGIHRDRWIPRTKCQLRGKCFHLMTSSCPIQNSWNTNISIWGVGAYEYIQRYRCLPIWGRQGPGGPHVGPKNFAIVSLGKTNLVMNSEASACQVHSHISVVTVHVPTETVACLAKRL